MVTMQHTFTLHYTAMQYTIVCFLLCRHSFCVELFGQFNIPQSQNCWVVLCTVYCAKCTIHYVLYNLQGFL